MCVSVFMTRSTVGRLRQCTHLPPETEHPFHFIFIFHFHSLSRPMCNVSRRKKTAKKEQQQHNFCSFTDITTSLQWPPHRKDARPFSGAAESTRTLHAGLCETQAQQNTRASQRAAPLENIRQQITRYASSYHATKTCLLAFSFFLEPESATRNGKWVTTPCSSPVQCGDVAVAVTITLLPHHSSEVPLVM